MEQERVSSSPGLASYDPTTPARPVQTVQRSKAVPKKTAAAHRSYGRPVAGPSKRPQSSTKRSKAKSAVRDSSISDVEEVNHQQELEMDSENEERPQTQVQHRKAVARGAASSLNGKASSSKGKGKEPQHESRDTVPDSLMDVDEIHQLTRIIEDDTSGLLNRTSKSNGTPNRSVDADFRRVERQLQQRGEELEILKKQVELLLKERVEQERAHEDWKVQYENSNETYKAYILERQQIERSASSNSSLTLHFLSREDADEEKKAVEKEISALKETISVKNRVIDQKDKQIAEISDAMEVLRSDLGEEIERGKVLASRSKTGGHTRALSEVPGIETQKRAAATRLYEDLTNVLVVGVRSERSEEVGDEVVFHCMYTHQGERINRSISFQLRQYFERKNGSPQETVKYVPLDLDKEQPGFKERLSFLGDAFTFEKHQMQVFYEQLKEKTAGALEADTPEEGRNVIDLRSDDDLSA